MKQLRSRPSGAPQERPRRLSGFWAAATVPLVYANMPKSGCTTIKNLLYRIDSGAFLDDPLTIHGRPELMVHAKAQPEEIERRLKTDVVFTFVRHPLKRAYSCFNEKIHFRSIYSFGKARDFIAARYGAEFVDAPSLELHRSNFKHFLRFSQDTCDKSNGFRRDPHWSPQSTVLAGPLRWRMLDFVGRVESFDAAHGRGAGARRRPARLRDAAHERGPAAALALRGDRRRRDPRRSAAGSSPTTCGTSATSSDRRTQRETHRMLASVEKGFVLLCNPKTGTTALEEAFEKFADIRTGGSPKWKHLNYDKMTAIFGDYFQRQGCKIYGVARHPADALVSWYRYRSRKQLRDPRHREKYTGDIPFSQFMEEWAEQAHPAGAGAGVGGMVPHPPEEAGADDLLPLRGPAGAVRRAVGARRLQGRGREAQRLAGAGARRRAQRHPGASPDAAVHRALRPHPLRRPVTATGRWRSCAGPSPPLEPDLLGKLEQR